MKVAGLLSDHSGCSYFRFFVPFRELKRYGVEFIPLFTLPTNPDKTLLNELYELISQVDLVFVQRCPKLTTLQPIRDICDILNKPLVFDTDDDYLNVDKNNPNYSMFSGDQHRANYIKILKMADAITVTTEELRNVYYPFNKNIYVFPNNVEYLPGGYYGTVKRDIMNPVNKEGRPEHITRHGVEVVPGYWATKEKTSRIIRIGYTGTESHKRDFETIAHDLERIALKYRNKVWFVFIGDPYFYKRFHKVTKQVSHIPVTIHHDQYLNHIRNLDIGIAPLERHIGNMARSSIKAVEYGQWGIPAVLPNYITYTREFTHEKNCLMYNNGTEFGEALSTLIEDDELRKKLGLAARDLVRDHRLEKDHAQRRYEFLENLVNSKRKIQRFKLEEVKVGK